MITITEQNRYAFEHLVPEEFFAPLDRQGHFVLGAVVQKEDGPYAAGVLVLDVVWEDEDFMGNLPWIYVVEEFRNRGVGDALLEETFRLLAASDIREVFCDLPTEPAYYGLMQFLEDWGFTFSWRERFQAMVTLKRLGEVLPLGKKTSLPVISLQSLSEELLQGYLSQITDTEAPVPDLEDRIQYCDKELSCVLPGKEGVEGMAVICPVTEGILEIVFLRIFSGQAAHMRSLCCFAFQKAVQKYGVDTQVRFWCRTNFAINFMNRLLPDIQPLSVYRGVCETFTEEEVDER